MLSYTSPAQVHQCSSGGFRPEVSTSSHCFASFRLPMPHVTQDARDSHQPLHRHSLHQPSPWLRRGKVGTRGAWEAPSARRPSSSSSVRSFESRHIDQVWEDVRKEEGVTDGKVGPVGTTDRSVAAPPALPGAAEAPGGPCRCSCSTEQAAWPAAIEAAVWIVLGTLRTNPVVSPLPEIVTAACLQGGARRGSASSRPTLLHLLQVAIAPPPSIPSPFPRHPTAIEKAPPPPSRIHRSLPAVVPHSLPIPFLMRPLRADCCTSFQCERPLPRRLNSRLLCVQRRPRDAHKDKAAQAESEDSPGRPPPQQARRRARRQHGRPRQRPQAAR